MVGTSAVCRDCYDELMKGIGSEVMRINYL